MEKSRIRNLSTRYPEVYRYGFNLLLSAVFVWIVVSKINEFASDGNWSDLLYFPIKDIEMKSLGGMWRVGIMPMCLETISVFKPSLLYPLNYKRKEALVNLLWQFH